MPQAANAGKLNIAAPLFAGVIAESLPFEVPLEGDPKRYFHEHIGWKRPGRGECVIWNTVNKTSNPPSISRLLKHQCCGLAIY